MKQIAEDVHVLEGFPPHAINVYLLGDVLVDSATRFDARRLLKRLKGRTVTAHALTHVHPDHQGSSSAICSRLNIPLWCGAGDADAMETPGLMIDRMHPHWFSRVAGGFVKGPPYPVARQLREGDQVGSFTVIETPGHTIGHVSYWRAADRVLIAGDVICNLNIWNGTELLCMPQRIFTLDPAQNRQSARRLVELEPRLIAFGHGPPLRDPDRLRAFINRLPIP